MSVEASSWAWKQPLQASTKLVLLALADHADNKGRCWPSMESIASKCGVSRSLVVEKVKELKEYRLITASRRFNDDGHRQSNMYQLHMQTTLSPDYLRRENQRRLNLHGDNLRRKTHAPKSRFRGPDVQDLDSNHHESSGTITTPYNPPVGVCADEHTHTRADDGFEQFYAAYPRKDNRLRAQRAWRRLKKAEKVAAMVAIATQFQGVDREFIPHPSTYLNGKRWEDETRPGNTPRRPVSAVDRVKQANSDTSDERSTGARNCGSAERVG